MQFGKVNLIFMAISIFLTLSFKTKLKRFETKQDIYRIRFVDQTGKLTYFQNFLAQQFFSVNLYFLENFAPTFSLDKNYTFFFINLSAAHKLSELAQFLSAISKAGP